MKMYMAATQGSSPAEQCTMDRTGALKSSGYLERVSLFLEVTDHQVALTCAILEVAKLLEAIDDSDEVQLQALTSLMMSLLLFIKVDYVPVQSSDSQIS